ncbi:hypothetical protein [Aeromicrobium fastidiosum]|uniref:Terpene cyclase/mutase family protein n=1 Tax=Aeromicrobium fastidiosum TaxID=52699 RepID=A0A641AMM3_9ACTN|nr:hypothetical protein [Aeromicrobium fastidiosum]KAA1378524.1 hypothetical protein ESP62_009250 [Aeromicrobium fastidiosum]MBP2392507.1 hypothetical protein [Aeromicrobium fastidiosum]
MTTDQNRTELLAAAKRAQQEAIAWIEQQLDAGRPRDAAQKNTWWRVPWALSVAGAGDTAAAVLRWAEQEALDDDADLRSGPAEFMQGASPVYELSALAIAAWRLGRYDLANALLDRCQRFQSPRTGGVYDQRERPEGSATIQDLLKTCQLGIAAIVAGRRDIADPIATWLRELWTLQPELPHVLYAGRSDDDDSLFIPAEDDFFGRFLLRVDFREPLQAYYSPGIAAAFLHDYRALTGSDDRDLARAFLQLNADGSDVQFTDPNSVQICKYAWGVACDVKLDPASPFAADAERMTAWFLDRQNDDGSWSPSSFGSTEVPPPVDRLWKTAEHLMELSFLIEALTVADPSIPTPDTTTREDTTP